MKKNIFFTFLLLTESLMTNAQDLTKYVNPMIGTVKMGHTFPGACVPHGGVQLSPDTDTIPHNIDRKYQKDVYKYCAGYQHDDPTIVGFSHTHMSGTGHSDLGDILIMPTTGDLKLNPGTANDPDAGYRSRVDHASEEARAGYYKVYLKDYNIKAELTATERTGVHKYTYPIGVNQQIIIDLIHGIYNYDGKVLWSSVRVLNDSTVVGFRLTNGWAKENYTYFAITFSKPMINYGYVEKEKVKYNGGWGKFDLYHNFPEISGRKIVTYFEFDSQFSDVLEIKVALSAVSEDGALKNLQAEVSGKTFNQIAKEASAKWDDEMHKFEIQGTEDQKTMFYTSLYHTLINPSVYMDVDGKYRGIDHQIHQAEGFTNYTVFSLWDTFRSLHPLFNLMNKDRAKDIAQSMIEHYKQSTHHMLPVWSHMGNENWCMSGYHGVSVLSDAITKGIPIDKAEALNAMVSTSNVNYYDHTDLYKKMGYVPYDKSSIGSSTTLEFSYDDWTIYKTASLQGDRNTAEIYKKRAMNYQNVFNPKTGFVGAKYSDGSWKTPASLLSTEGEGFIEGNAWNFSFFVPHDVKGMIKLMGGDKEFVNKLDKLFTMHISDEFFEHTEDVTREGILGGYVHGNEPSHHIVYLYNWTSQPWKTQYWIREIMDKMYKNSIDGLCGNDDCGQMSAWYIFTAMGFYPVCPGSDEYVLGAPYLPYMRINLGGDKFITIKAPKVSDKMPYVKSVKLNGQVYNKSYITQRDIENGAELFFEMTSSPNKKRVFAENQKPYSLSK